MTLKKKIALLGIISLVGLGMVLLQQYMRNNAQRAQAELITRNIQTINSLSQTIHELQKERGLSTISLITQDFNSVRQQYPLTDAALTNFDALQEMSANFNSSLEQLRMLVGTKRINAGEARDRYTILIRDMMDKIDRLTRQTESKGDKDDIAAHLHLVIGKEYLGQMRATVGYLLGEGRSDAVVRQDMARIKSLFDEELRKYMLEASAESRSSFQAQFAGAEVESTLAIIAQIAGAGRGPSGLTTDEWWAKATVAIDGLKKVEEQSLRINGAEAASKLAELQNSMLSGVLLTIGVSVVVLTLTILTIVGLFKALDRLLISMELIANTQDFGLRVPVDSYDEIGRIL